MVHIANHANTFDEASRSLREALAEIEGVSEETLERIDFISQPRTDAPPPHDEERHEVYNRLVLLALSEATLEAQKVKAKPVKAKA